LKFDTIEAYFVCFCRKCWNLNNSRYYA